MLVREPAVELVPARAVAQQPGQLSYEGFFDPAFCGGRSALTASAFDTPVVRPVLPASACSSASPACDTTPVPSA